MTRLIFAAARGARIQYRSNIPGDYWVTTKNILPKVYGLDQWRVHPDDVNLQYGPLSTELRRYAELGGWSYTDVGRMAQSAFSNWIPYLPVFRSEELHFSLCALFLAEILADEGL